MSARSRSATGRGARQRTHLEFLEPRRLFSATLVKDLIVGATLSGSPLFAVDVAALSSPSVVKSQAVAAAPVASVWAVSTTNVIPTVNAGPDVNIIAGATFSYAAGSFTDPNLDLWSATVNYGDGSGAL